MTQNLKEIDRVKQSRNSVRVIKDSAKVIGETTDLLHKAKIEFKLLVKETEILTASGIPQKDLAQKAGEFNQKLLEHKATIEFYEKKIKYAAHTILAESELL